MTPDAIKNTLLPFLDALTKKEDDEAADLEKLTDLQKETFRIDAGPSRRDAVNQSNVEAAKIFLLKLKSGNNPRFIQYYRAIEAKLKAEKITENTLGILMRFLPG